MGAMTTIIIKIRTAEDPEIAEGEIRELLWGRYDIEDLEVETDNS